MKEDGEIRCLKLRATFGRSAIEIVEDRDEDSREDLSVWGEVAVDIRTSNVDSIRSRFHNCRPV